MKPKTTFGIELEFSLLNSTNYNSLKRWLTNRFNDKWELGTDSSVSGYGSELRTKGGLEIVDLLKDFKVISQKLSSYYKEDKLYVDSSAGFHIHIGIKDWTLGDLEKFHYCFLHSIQDWFAFQPPSRQNNHFCHRNIDDNIYAEIGDHQDHYKAINVGNSLARHGTIELRMFAGTIQFWKVFNTLHLINQYIKEIRRIKEDRPAETTLRKIVKNKKLKDFYMQRVKQLNPHRYFTIKAEEETICVES